MDRFQKFVLYTALGLSLVGCSARKAEVPYVQPISQEVSDSAQEPVACYTFYTKKGDNPWKLAKMTYGKGTEWKKIFDYDDFNPNRDVQPDMCVSSFVETL